MKKRSTSLMLVLALLVSFNVFSIPVLNSLSTAPATIYLDFDGHNVNSAYWNGGVPFTCAAPGMTDTDITEIFNRVAEDYRPFNINITTDSSRFLSAPLNKRIRVVITPTSNWFTGVGGVSFIGSFKWGDDTPAFVFCDRLGPNNPKMVAECCSHESGHSVGLSHQSKYDVTCNLTATYNDGTGSGEAAWAPIMGNSYYRNMSGWNNGPTPYGCTNTQDNLSIITSQNGFTYREDDHSNDISFNPSAIDISTTVVKGIITTNTDKDAFKFTLNENANFSMDVRPFSVGANYAGANLDIKVSLYNASKILINSYNPSGSMYVTVDTILNAGAYYMLVEGTGNTNVNNYGSLGSYTITRVAGSLPIHSVTLTGRSDKNKHALTWSIISDDPVKSIVVQSSTDGIIYNTINTLNGQVNNFSYTPLLQNDLYYRLLVTSILKQTNYSNVISLKGVTNPGKSFNVSTFGQNEISVNAAEQYQYRLCDINGNVIAKGNGKQGINKLNISHHPVGVYVLQLLSNNKKQTERIIKQ